MLGVAEVKAAAFLALAVLFSCCVSERSCVDIKEQKVRDACYMGAVMSGGGASICPQVSNASMRDACFSWTAVASLDASLCEEISAEEKQEECRLMLANLTSSEGGGVCAYENLSSVDDVVF